MDFPFTWIGPISNLFVHVQETMFSSLYRAKIWQTISCESFLAEKIMGKAVCGEKCHTKISKNYHSFTIRESGISEYTIFNWLVLTWKLVVLDLGIYALLPHICIQPCTCTGFYDIMMKRKLDSKKETEHVSTVYSNTKTGVKFWKRMKKLRLRSNNGQGVPHFWPNYSLILILWWIAREWWIGDNKRELVPDIISVFLFWIAKIFQFRLLVHLSL